MDCLEQIYNFNDNPTHEEIFLHLKYISKLLTEHNFKHWILYGTLLGAIREKSIIKYDYDFDLGILYEDHMRILTLNEVISKDGYVLEKGNGVMYNINVSKPQSEPEYKWRVSLKLKHNDKIIGDLYTYYKCKDGFMRRYDPEDKIYYWPNSTFPCYFIENLIEVEINGVLFPAPQDPEVLILHYYGPHWKIPIKALSQDGENHPDYDFYGNYKYSSLQMLINFVNEKPNTTDYLNLNTKLQPDFSKDEINFIFPLDQLDYIKENENIIIKLKH